MAIVTQLSPTATPGMPYAFIAKPIGINTPTVTDELTDWLYIYDRRHPAIPATVGVPAADFTWSTINFPTVPFRDQSVGANSWLWNFAGRGSSAAQNPDFDLVVIGPSQVFAITLQINGDPLLTRIHNVEVPGVASVTLNTLTLGQLEVLSLPQLESLILE